MVSFILSCSTITWGQMRGAQDFEGALRAIKSTGFPDVGIEYPNIPQSLKDNPAVGGELAEKNRLSVSAVAIDTTPVMGKVVRAFGSRLGWLCLFEKDFEVATQKTKRLVAACADSGVEVALHPHVRSNIETTEQLDALIRACEPNRTSVCLDTAHLTALDINPKKFAERYANLISLVHMKDLRVKKPPSEIDYEKDFVDLGDGVADLRGAISELRRTDYAGAVMVEVDYPPNGKVEASVRKNFEVIKGLV